MSNGETISAESVIAGYRYQFLQAIAVLLAFRKDEMLLLEVTEDFSVSAANIEVAYQVKHSQAKAGPKKVSLQSDAVLKALERFWNESAENGEKLVRLVFLTRGKATYEKGVVFPGRMTGIEYWRHASVDADTGPLRQLLSKKCAGSLLADWLKTDPSDDEFRRKLLSSVDWQTNQPVSDELMSMVLEQARDYCDSLGFPVSLAEQAIDGLLSKVLEVSSRREASIRILRRVDCKLIFENVLARSLLAQFVVAPSPLGSDEANSVLIDEVTDLPRHIARRSITTAKILESNRGEPLIWVYGPNGVGKSTLAKLLAINTGGAWIALDLRPVQQDAQSCLVAWKALASRLLNDASLRGIIIDDFANAALSILQSRLSTLVRIASGRGVRVLVTSPGRPTTPITGSLDMASSAIVEAPYFSISDVEELVRGPGAPNPDLIEGWSNIVHVTTSGGQPVLVSAKVASLRARNWPDSATLEDFATTSEAVRLSRTEARKRLLNDLNLLDHARSMESGQLLRRIASVFDVVEEDLVTKLALHDPTLTNASDSLAFLKGSWLESSPQGELRISPLLSDISSDVLPTTAKQYRRIAAEFWLAKRKLDSRSLPRCFWNALWGEHVFVLLKICELFVTMSRRKQKAAAPLLLPFVYMSTDIALFPGNAHVSMQLRILQVSIAESTDNFEIARKACEKFIEEFNNSNEASRYVLMMIFGLRVLSTSNMSLRPAVRLNLAISTRIAMREVEFAHGVALPSAAGFLPPAFTSRLDPIDFLFSRVIADIESTEDTFEAIVSMDGIDRKQRDNFLEAIAETYGDVTILANSGWSKDQLAGRDLSKSHEYYRKMQVIVEGWQNVELAAAVVCAISVILDEGINRWRDAFDEIERGIAQFGSLPMLFRQKAKLLGHAKRFPEAFQVISEVEERESSSSGFTRYLELREFGVLAAKAEHLENAERSFDLACNAISGESHLLAFAYGIRVDGLLAAWRLGKRLDAVGRAKDILMDIGNVKSDSSKQAQRVHSAIRVVIAEMHFNVLGVDQSRSLSWNFGDASQVELSDQGLWQIEFPPIGDSWRKLASIESKLGFDMGIRELSSEKIENDVDLSVEAAFWAARYEQFVSNRVAKLGEALDAGMTLVHLQREMMERRSEESKKKRIAVQDLRHIDIDRLFNDTISSTWCFAVVTDLMVSFATKNQIGPDLLAEFQGTCNRKFSGVAQLGSYWGFLTRQVVAARASQQYEVLATGLGILSSDVAIYPDARLYRDVMMAWSLKISLAKEVLLPLVANEIKVGWQFVVRSQRFRINNPTNNLPSLIESLSNTDGSELEQIARILDAARNGVRHNLDEHWFSEIL
jgi:hypothetical protein